MKLSILFIVFLSLFLSFTLPAKAIVVLVPVVLVPIVKIVALIIGALATPVVGVSAWYLKLKKKPVLYGIIIGVVALLILGGLITIGIKIANPNRPLY